jgi:hypothetical protein
MEQTKQTVIKITLVDIVTERRLGLRNPNQILFDREFLEDGGVVVPGDLSKNRLHECLIRPRLSEHLHVF